MPRVDVWRSLVRKWRPFAWAIAAVMAGGCAGLPAGMQRPSVTLAEVGIVRAGFLEQQLALKFRVQNPNSAAFTIDGMAFELELNDEPLARGVGNSPVTVPRYGSALMDVEAVSTLSTLFRQAAKIAADKPGLKYRIKGELSIEGGTRIPFDRRGELDFSGGVLKPR